MHGVSVYRVGELCELLHSLMSQLMLVEKLGLYIFPFLDVIGNFSALFIMLLNYAIVLFSICCDDIYIGGFTPENEP